MGIRLTIFVLFFVGMLLLFIVFAVRKGKIEGRASILWMIIALAILVVSLLPQIPEQIALAIGIVYPPSITFFTAICVCYMILCYQSIRIHNLSEKNKDLAQRYALQEERLRILLMQNKSE